MVIKAVSKDRIDEALQEFDRNHRMKPQWQGWESNQAHRYAIDANGARYPAKKVVSLATGVPVGEFSGGHPTNSYLERRGFTIVELPRGTVASELCFIPGEVYDRKTEINGPFGGSHQSGIAPSSTHPAIFIFSGASGKQYGYADHWEHGAFFYTGEGKIGDMTMDRGNKAIAEHAKDGRALHVFESLGKGRGYRYVGEFACADLFERIQPDEAGKDRTAIVFRLVPVDAIAENEEGEAEELVELPNSLEAARLAALKACDLSKNEVGESAPRKIYQRSRKVAHYVLMRAAGICESCEKPAPFLKKDGSPYLEPHHVNRLSDGGLDHPRFVAGICPSCHREIHSGMDGAVLNERLRVRLLGIESD